MLEERYGTRHRAKPRVSNQDTARGEEWFDHAQRERNRLGIAIAELLLCHGLLALIDFEPDKDTAERTA